MGIGEVLFGGRINRGAYWLITLGMFVVTMVIVMGLVFAPLDSGASRAAAIVIGAIVALVFVMASAAVAIKRLHDRDKSGWWLLVFYLVPAILDGVRETLQGSSLAAAFALASAGIGLWAFIELGCLRGTEGYNDYGPDPLG